MRLDLDLNASFVPEATVSEVLRDAFHSTDVGSQIMAKPKDIIKMLEDEMSKIDASVLELPLCRALVKDAIAKVKEEMEQEPVFDKSIAEETHSGGKRSLVLMGQEICVNNMMMTETAKTKSGNEGHQFPPHWFVAANQIPKLNEANINNGEALMIPSPKMNTGNSENGLGGGSSALSASSVEIQDQSESQKSPKKPRRRWTRMLHERFVQTIQGLGGPQVATPKKIIDMMHMDDLTINEVKSHLQKYRHHLKGLPDSSNNQYQGGLWMAQNQFGQGSNGSLSQFGFP